ncbi:MAG: hypothetical protein ACM34K_16580 [Bacillota bacterium]
MKLKYFFVGILFVPLFFQACKKDDSNPASNQQQTIDAQRYYPGNVGSRFSYTNSPGNGIRNLTFTGTKSIGGVSYISQNSISYVGLDSLNATTYFRRTPDAVYFYIDTTGLMKFFPDSLKSLLTFNIDKEIIAFSSNLDKTKPWSAYKMDVKIANLANVNIIDLTANYLGDENMTLNLTSGQVTKAAKKIRYDFKLSVPNLSNLSSPTTRTFSANAWFAEDVGIVRLEGDASVLGALGGGNINLGDTTKVITQTITAYDIKP